MKQKHLGGNSGRTWTDAGVLDYLIATKNVKNMLDVGCGPGGQMDLAEQRGLKVLGIDGDPDVANDSRIQIHDFTVKPLVAERLKYLPESGYFDLGWSVEFLEHVEERYIDNYMPCLAACKYVVVTHATPGQGGHHHVNEQLFDYWQKVFDRYDLVYNEKITKKMRNHSSMRQKKLNHFLRFNENGKPVNTKAKNSFMRKTGRFFVNKKFTNKGK